MTLNAKEIGRARLERLVTDGSVRMAVVAAHPDDEVVGAGVQLRRWRDAHIIYVTDGAPPNPQDAREAGYSTAMAYAIARYREALRALSLCGIGSERVQTMGFPDQGASFHLCEIAVALAEILIRLRPEVVVTHPYEGGHPDHDAVAFAAHAARRIAQHQSRWAPTIIEMTSYHNSNGFMQTGRFLQDGEPGDLLAGKFSAQDHAFKQQLFSCFQTQQKVLQYFPTSPELFRVAPEYDFSQPPHAGGLYYEFFDWGMRGERWRQLAREATSQINSRIQAGIPHLDDGRVPAPNPSQPAPHIKGPAEMLRRTRA